MSDQGCLFGANDEPTEPALQDGQRRLPQGCQVERQLTAEEWQAFIACAQNTWRDGEFRHNRFEEKRLEHPEATDDLIAASIRMEASLVAYRDEGMERVTLWDRYGTGLVVVAVLKDGIITAYRADNFERSTKMTKTNVRWLREL